MGAMVLALLLAVTPPGATVAQAVPASPADCVWTNLLASREALLGIPVNGHGDWSIAAKRLIPAEDLARAAFLCGGQWAATDEMALSLLEARSRRLAAEAELPDYSPQELAAALDDAHAEAAVRDMLGSEESGDAARDRHFEAFVARLRRPPTAEERSRLQAWFAARVGGWLVDGLWRLEADATTRFPVEVEEATLRRDADLFARQARPAWEKDDPVACAAHLLAEANPRRLYVNAIIAGGALADEAAYPRIQALKKCGAATDQAAMLELGNNISVLAGERALIDRFEPVRLDAAFATLSPTQQIEQTAEDYGLATTSPALKAFRRALGLKPETDVNHPGSDFDDRVNGYFFARAIQAAQKGRP